MLLDVGRSVRADSPARLNTGAAQRSNGTVGVEFNRAYDAQGIPEQPLHFRSQYAEERNTWLIYS